MMRVCRKGFTLIELLITIVIIAILAAIFIPYFVGYVVKSERSKDETNCSSLFSQASQELFSDQALSIGDSEAEPNANTGHMVIQYTIDATSEIFSSFVCKKDSWTHTIK
ncbi:MAG: hypothetical protein FD133_756 [Erysipelotrichaceae bacterium]|nr:MAG: hypothetical protein FD179_1198 [Erysipelotrichaceae bacterium]TXT18597.1 MAG: hypothetical protein FD133_756 [Erysipelotrichaceae bacterium]